MADLFRAEEEFWQKLLEDKFPPIVRSCQRDSIILDIPSLAAESFPLRLRVLRLAIEKLLGNLRRIGFPHILMIDGLLQNPEPNKDLQLPQGLCVSRAYHALVFSKRRGEVAPFEHSIPGPGYIEVPEIGRALRFEVQPVKPRRHFLDSSAVAWMDFDAIDFPLLIRSFRPGDRFQPLGMQGVKKVKDLFMDYKIPLGQRKRIPLLFKDEQLLWVVGVRIDHRVRLKPETRRALRVEFL